MRTKTCFGTVFDLDYSPDGERIAAGQVDGRVEIFDINPEKDEKKDATSTFKRHKCAVRQVRYFPDNRLLSASSNGSIGIGVGEDISWLRKKTGIAVNAIEMWDDHCFCYGEDNGRIGAYDTRQKASDGPLFTFREQGDYISSMKFGKDGMLCAGAGDGRLGVFDLRKKKLFALSDEQEDEILCMEMMKDRDKVLCGGTTGVISVFNWGDFGDQKDRITDHPDSVDQMLKISEDMVVTGGGDGIMRLVSAYHQAHGNRILSTIDEHKDCVQALAMAPNGKNFASVGLDGVMKLWTTEEALASMDLTTTNRTRPTKKRKFESSENQKKLEAKAFFDDM